MLIVILKNRSVTCRLNSINFNVINGFSIVLFEMTSQYQTVMVFLVRISGFRSQHFYNFQYVYNNVWFVINDMNAHLLHVLFNKTAIVTPIKRRRIRVERLIMDND